MDATASMVDHTILLVADNMDKDIWEQQLRQTPAILRSTCRRIEIFQHCASEERLQYLVRDWPQHGVAGLAVPEYQCLTIWGAKPGVVRLRTLHHELAHLHSDDGGPPRSLRRAWRKAQQADMAYHVQYAENISCLDTNNAEAFRPTIFASPWITAYAQESDSRRPKNSRYVEDWAESVSLYLYDQRHGHLMEKTVRQGWRRRQTVQRYTFAALFPYRAHLIQQWLHQ